MSKNSLATLIGQYSSDSENEDESANNSGTNGNRNESIEEKNKQLPTTQWTQCNDPNTGHPYYWNVETKEVTWEPPEEYEEYLKNISTFFTNIPDDCWIRGYSQAIRAKYYVNEYTRVVSWEKPKNYKEPEDNTPVVVAKTSQNKKAVQIKEKKGREGSPRPLSILKRGKTSPQPSSILKKKNNTVKKSLPSHLEQSSDDEKIELICSYIASDTSSEEDAKKTEEKDNMSSVTALNRNLVAAYSTDESDSEIEEITNDSRLVKPANIEVQDKDEILEDGEEDSDEKEISNSSNLLKTTFSNIIVGGGISDSIIDEEILRLKKELENDLISFENENEKKEKSPEISENFDEKTFQRKKRIQYKTSSKNSEISDSTAIGFNSSNLKKEKIQVKQKDKYNLYKHFKRSHVEFENTKENRTENSHLSVDDESDKIVDIKCSRKEIDDLSDIISGKIKFLAVGHPDVTAVQAMNIQLETLVIAFRSSALNSEYFFKWLKATSDDLTSLEKNACPEGWKCIWDRESSQYCYKNLTTGDVQWEFPEDKTNDQEDDDDDDDDDAAEEVEIAGGEDEMDISTTPPPNENEQLKIENEIPPWDECNPPPPPIISRPSPSPPPNISCEIASFYSDIAILEPLAATTKKSENNRNSSPTASDTTKKRVIDDSSIKKKRKKVKVHGLGLKMKEVNTMVANWKKAQRELDN